MQTETESLWALASGSEAVIYTLPDGGLRRRLMELGFIEGSLVRVLQRSPSGSPIAYEIRGTVIALRQEDAGGIRVIRHHREQKHAVKERVSYGAT